jgi:ADP-heptose:LPS heptosyltransferase
MAPASVWFTKQLPKEKWVELIKNIPNGINIYLIGAPSDLQLCEEIIQASSRKGINNLCGQLSLLQSAALMKSAKMNYVNDSAPMHLASAMNAPTTAFFCSTIPEFGFGPLSNESVIMQVSEPLTCRPCGLHGKSACPEGHFDCGYQIDLNIRKEAL